MTQRFAPRLKLALHPQFASVVRREPTRPINVEISPSGLCQASCDFCGYASGVIGEHRAVFLDPDILKKLVEDCHHMGVKSISWTGGGEPSLYPHLYFITRFVAAHGIQQGIFTNALAMPKYDPALMQWVRVTMTDKPYRPDVIKALRPAKTLGFAFNYAGPHDLDYLWQTLHLAEDVMADYVQVRPALKQCGETVEIAPPTIDHPLLQVTGYKFDEAKRKHGYMTCEGYKLSPFVWEDGNVDVCAYMRNHPGYTLGNLYRQSFKAIMADAPDSVPVSPSCQVCCKLHETNIAIHEARELEDVNFP